MRQLFVVFVAICLSMVSLSSFSEEPDRVRPFILAESSAGALDAKSQQVRDALTAGGFSIVGEYAPYPRALILIVTNEDLRKNATATEFGGYGAALRVSITEANGELQVSYTNPLWMGNVYRLSGSFEATAERMKAALGWKQGFGSGGGRTVNNLRKYHYMMFMPYFDDQVLLAEYSSHNAAVEAVEQGLSEAKGGVAKVSRVDLIGKDEVLFNVSIQSGAGADKPVMEVIDQADLKHTAHLPYDLLVSGNRVYMLHGKFRIAQSFPDLTMTTFMKISDAPDSIEAALKQAVSKP